MTTTNQDYNEKLQAEAALWGDEAQRQAQGVPPDWRYHRLLRHNVIMHNHDIVTLLSKIRPGMQTLELGCASGWLTLAMAQRGADATGIDISATALQVARDYYEQVKAEVLGTVQYEQADLNTVQLPAETYDIIAVKGTLHHLVNLPDVIKQMHQALKPGGLLWVSDTTGDEHISTVLIAGALTLLLPTETPYREKFAALRRFGLRTPQRVRASIQAEGLSPFEGVGREHDWLALVQQRFDVRRLVDAPALTGYVTAQLRAPDWIALPLLLMLRTIDKLLGQWGLLHNTGVTVYARKR